MRVLRAIGGALLWVVASLVGLVAVLLCVTVVLLPLGIPLLGLARRLFAASIALFLPRAARHPLAASGDAAKDAVRQVADRVDTGKAHRLLTKGWKKVASA